MGIVFLLLLLAQFEPEPRFGAPFAFPFRMAPTDHIGRKDFLPVEPQGGLSFLFRLSEPRFA